MRRLAGMSGDLTLSAVTAKLRPAVDVSIASQDVSFSLLDPGDSSFFGYHKQRDTLAVNINMK